MYWLKQIIIQTILILNVYSIYLGPARTLDHMIFKEIYDTKVSHNGRFAYVSMKDNMDKQRLIQVNITQSQPSLIYDFQQPNIISLSKKRIFHFPDTGIVGGYSIETDSHPYFNDSTGQFIDLIQGRYSQIHHSTIFNQVIYINEKNQTYYNIKNNFINNISTLSTRLSLEIIFIYQNIGLTNSQNKLVVAQLFNRSTVFSFFDINNTKITFFQKLHSNIYDIIMYPISWKNYQSLYYIYSTRICKIQPRTMKNKCNSFTNLQLKAVKYVYMFDRVLLYALNYSNVKSAVIYFLNSQSLSINRQFNYQLNNNLIDVSVDQFSDRIVITEKLQNNKVNFKTFVMDYYQQSNTNTTNTTNNTTTNTTKTTNSTNSTNSTNTTNTTNTNNNTGQNSTQNTTNNTSTQNTTNTSSNSSSTTNTTTNSSTTNSSSKSNSKSLNNSSSSFNSTTNQIQLNNQIINKFIKQQFSQSKQIISDIMQNNMIIGINKIPGIRGIIKPLGTFFINFGDLFLYYYHQGQYNYIILSYLETINNLQQDKWNMLDLNNLWNHITNNIKYFQNTLTWKKQYTSKRYLQIENKSSQFYINNLYFLFPNFLMTFIIFLIFRLIFYTFKQFQILILFSFWLYFVVILLQGNLQYFAYFFAFELKYFFTVDFIHKICTSILLIIFLLIFLFTSSSFFIFQYLYKILSNHFFANIKRSNLGSYHLITYKGIKYIFFGFTHMIFGKYSEIQLLFVEIVFITGFIIVLVKRKIVQRKISAWVEVITTFVRMLLIFTLCFSRKSVFKYLEIQILDCEISVVLVAIYIVCQILIVTIQLLFVLAQLSIKIIKSITENNKAQEINQCNITKIQQSSAFKQLIRQQIYLGMLNVKISSQPQIAPKQNNTIYIRKEKQTYLKTQNHLKVLNILTVSQYISNPPCQIDIIN